MSIPYKRLFIFMALLLSANSFAHGVDSQTENFLSTHTNQALGAFMYIGAKHMLTGYDHILFLIGVIFFLYRPRDILIYVSLFTLGHSLTLLIGVLTQLQLNSYLVDAIIASSIIYKGFDNLNGFKILLHKQPNTKIAVLAFGFIHGFGLATKLQDFKFAPEHLLNHLLAFNIGVEIGQCIALLFILTLLNIWRRYQSYYQFSVITNSLLMSAGWLLFAYQLTAYVSS